LFGREAFVEADTHAKTRADIDDSARKIEHFVGAAEFDTNHRAAAAGIQRIHVAAGAADVTGACVEASAGGYLGNFRDQDERQSVCVATIFHSARHSGSPILYLKIRENCREMSRGGETTLSSFLKKEAQKTRKKDAKVAE
jgi:hypothetical protein